MESGRQLTYKQVSEAVTVQRGCQSGLAESELSHQQAPYMHVSLLHSYRRHTNFPSQSVIQNSQSLVCLILGFIRLVFARLRNILNVMLISMPLLDSP